MRYSGACSFYPHYVRTVTLPLILSVVTKTFRGKALVLYERSLGRCGIEIDYRVETLLENVIGDILRR